VRFKATVLATGKTSAGIEVPATVVEALGSRHPKVRATINGYTYRSSVGSMGGRFMLPVSTKVREESGVSAGDAVTVSLEIDDAPRQVAVPADLAKELRREPAAKAFFEGLSYSQQRWFVEPIEAAKKPETRTRRIEAAMARLREGRGQR